VHPKFFLCRSLTQTALGRIDCGMEDLEMASRMVYEVGMFNDMNKTKTTKYRKMTVYNELIRLKPIGRCGNLSPDGGRT
jgi:hypothetical protein